MVGTGSVPAMELTELAVSEQQPPTPPPSKQGRQWTDEERARMSAKCSGRVVSQETKDKIKATYAAKRAAREALALATTPTAPQVPSRVAPGRHRKLESEWVKAQQRAALLAQQVAAARVSVEDAYQAVDRAEYALASIGEESLMAQSEVYRIKCQLMALGVDPSVLVPAVKLGDGVQAVVPALHLRDDDAADHPAG